MEEERLDGTGAIRNNSPHGCSVNLRISRELCNQQLIGSSKPDRVDYIIQIRHLRECSCFESKRPYGAVRSVPSRKSDSVSVRRQSQCLPRTCSVEYAFGAV